MGGFADNEIPLLLMLFYLFHHVASSHPRGCLVFDLNRPFMVGELRGRHRQVGSLAGAAHLLNDNAGVLRVAQREQKSRVEQKGKSDLDSGTFTST